MAVIQQASGSFRKLRVLPSLRAATDTAPAGSAAVEHPDKAQHLKRRYRKQRLLLVPASQCWAGTGFLLAVCLDQALDELLDVARLGQLPFGQLVAQLGLGEALVSLASLVMSLPGLAALGEAGLARPLLLGQLGLLSG